MKKSKLKAIADALKQAQMVANAVCESAFVPDARCGETCIYINIPRAHESTYEMICKLSGVQVLFMSNNHIQLKEVRFDFDWESLSMKRVALEVVFEYLCVAVPELDLRIIKND